MITDKLIEKFKNRRKQGFLDLAGQYKHKYAFVGVGAHSIMNLYPCISYQAIPLKYIVTKNGINGEKMAKRFPECKGTVNLSEVLHDESVKGIFICTNPESHFSLALQCLNAGKNLFVEKPICKTLEEFSTLENAVQQKGVIATVGLQKRWATVYKMLQSRVKNQTVSYNLSYQTGAYPEGDALLDLFVHPLDLSVFLFGGIQDVVVKKQVSGSSVTYFIILTHLNGSNGVLELSTAYSWNQASEKICVNTSKGVFETENMRYLHYTEKPGVILGIPMEKIRKNTPKKQILFENTGFMPIESYNPLKTNGYYDEIKNFAYAVEGHSAELSHSLQQVKETWALIHDIRNKTI